MPKSFIRRFTKHTFITGNIIACLLFLLGCYGYFFNPDYFWPIGFLTLGVFYLFIVVALFMIFWFFTQKKKRMYISLITLLMAFPALKAIIPVKTNTFFNKIKQPQSIRVMSWNIEHFAILEHKTHPEIKTEMLDVINSYEPDIACFQEMVGSDSFTNAINYVPALQKDLKFTSQHFSYNWKNNFDEKHHFGIIIFSKYPVVNAKTISYTPNDYNSIFQYADVAVNTDTIRVFNLHLQSLKLSPDNLKYIENPDIKDDAGLKQTKSLLYKLKVGFVKRKVQAERIREEISKSPYPVIVCGDFNDVPNSYAYHTIGKGLQNTFEQKGSGLGKTYIGKNKRSISPTLRIDNIFAGNEFKVTQFTTVKKNLSDHYPVVSDVELEKK